LIGHYPSEIHLDIGKEHEEDGNCLRFPG
jgi:hypothetical protein